jgi:hypothetical protein
MYYRVHADSRSETAHWVWEGPRTYAAQVSSLTELVHEIETEWPGAVILDGGPGASPFEHDHVDYRLLDVVEDS